MPRNKLLPPEDSRRCTGRTTALALLTLAKAIQGQGRPVQVFDHYSLAGPRPQAEVMYAALRKAEKQLDLKHIEVTINTSDGSCTVTSHIWE